MEKQHFTLRLEEDLKRGIKIYAINHGTTVTAILKEMIIKVLDEDKKNKGSN